ncbi:hypothetical protein PHMEG_0002200 [Phytophthora megakarya]|uniref:Uncharacterized protein n=1 Tax=Phytophthora megakarya TaxID=4795 RepID=A0A225WZD2_9STRA|nr:hypothetical protein PHMEG_0002200 [Phytophthora megakarya]
MGMRRDVEPRIKGIYIVGKINIIVSQLRVRRPPKGPHLRKLYDQCRGMVDTYPALIRDSMLKLISFCECRY